VLKQEAKNIAVKQDNIGKGVASVSKEADKTEKKLDKVNKTLKDMLEKIGHDRICVDIVLICICLGMIAVLYNVIKSNIGTDETTTPTNEVKKFLY